MLWCQVIIFLLVLLLSAINGQVLYDDPYAAGYPAPKLHPLQDQHVVPTGENFTLRCAGKFELEWVLPTEGDPAIMDRVMITHEVIIPGDNPRPHVSHLNLYNLVYLDTGRYYCRYKGTKDNNVYDNVTTTYIFASSPTELLDTSSKMVFVRVDQYQEIHIACRPTHPDVKMTFFKEEVEISDKLQSFLLKYDPKVGLIIVEGRISYHSGLIECRAAMNGHEQKLVAFLTYRPVPNHIPNPDITNLDPGYNVIGGTLSLECRVNVDYNTAHIELVWGFPEKVDVDKSLASGRIHIKKQERVIDKSGNTLDPSTTYVNNNYGMTSVSKEILIDPLQPEDVGVYTCQSVVGTFKSPKSDFHLNNVRNGLNDPFIEEATFQGHPVISLDSSHGKRPVRWIFKMFAGPDPSYLWLNPRGGELEHTELEKYEMDINPKTGEIKLVINDVGLSDTGHYVFHVEVQGGNEEIVQRDIDIFLKYNQDPKVSLTSTVAPSGDLYLKSVSYQLVCAAEGYPLDMDNLTWAFQPCKSFADCSQETFDVKPDIVIPVDDVLDDDYHFRYKSRLNVTSDLSGIYTCEVCRKFDPANDAAKLNCNRSSLNFFLSEYQDGFSIVVPTDSGQIVDGDKVKVDCGASVYKYKSVQWFKKDFKKPDEWIPANQVSQIKVNQRKTELSISSTLSFDNIVQDDDGIYQCRAVSLTTSNFEMKDFRLRVLPAISPQRSISNNVNDTETTVEMSKEIYLDCSTEGRPEPIVEWFKDGEPLSTKFLENSSYVELRDKGSILHIVFALPQHSGNYECQATNRAGFFKNFIKLTVEEPYVTPTGLIVGIVVAIVLVICLSLILIWKVRAYEEKYKELSKLEVDKFRDGDPSSINNELGVDDQAELLPYNKKYEFPREKLTLGKLLGSGAFGRVLKGQAEGIVPWEDSTVVAVKMLKPKTNTDYDYLKALMVELKIMIHLGKHINILNVLGACTGNLHKRELLVITEYCRFGNIQKYLFCHRNHFVNQIDPTTGEIDYDIGRLEYDSMIPFSNHNSVARTSSSASGRKSVRYTIQPKQPLCNGSIQSDYLEDGQVVVTGMTSLASEGSDVDVEQRRLRTLSSISTEQGPIWRGNVGGDYDHRSMKKMFTKDLICWAYQVAQGMDYLTSKKVMHGDLACRNILLASNNVIKICDFGLAKDMYKSSIYQKKTKTLLPIKWMAVESIRDGTFSTQSDVWSFGIVLWELFSLGCVPYPGIDAGDSLFHKIYSGYRNEIPKMCPTTVYQIMLNCWLDSPNQRPSFAKLKNELGHLLEEGDKASYVEQCCQFEGSIAKLKETLGKDQSTDLENRDYLAMMSSPNYSTQTSVRPSMSFENIAFGECGYLIPNSGPGPSLSQDGYLLPDKQTSLAVDNEGYLLASPTPLPATSADGNITENKFEHWPMLRAKDNGNIVAV